MSDPVSNIPIIQIRNINEPYIPYWTIRQPYVPNFNPITNYMGFPIVDMPGCVESHQDNKNYTSRLPFDKDLVNQDPKGTTTLCPNGQYPSYNAMDYEPEQLTVITEQKAPPVASPPDPPESPETPTDTKVPEEKEPECPGPNAPRIGDIEQNQKEKVSEH